MHETSPCENNPDRRPTIGLGEQPDPSSGDGFILSKASGMAYPLVRSMPATGAAFDFGHCQPDRVHSFPRSSVGTRVESEKEADLPAARPWLTTEFGLATLAVTQIDATPIQGRASLP